MSEPTDAHLSQKLIDDAAFVERIISQRLGEEIAGRIRLAAQRLEPREVSEAMVESTVRTVCDKRYGQAGGCRYPGCDCDMMPEIIRAVLEAAKDKP